MEQENRPSPPWLLPTFRRGWPWLLYLDIALPLVLWLLAYLLGVPLFSRLFHYLGLYVNSTAPIDVDGSALYLSLTGIPGLLLHLYAIVRGLLRRDRIDALLCFVMAILMFVYFFFGWNYVVIRPLEF
jgi:hypothetical protein